MAGRMVNCRGAAGCWASVIGLGLGLVLAGWGSASGAGNKAEGEADRASGLGSYLAARHAERQRDATGAAEFALGALKNDPDNSELMTRTNVLLISAGRFDDAVPLARRLMSVSPGQPVAHLTVAVALSRSRDFAAAEAALSVLPNSGVNRVVLPLARAWFAQAQGRPDEAQAILAPVGEIDGFRPLAEFHAGLLAELAGRASTAESHYRRSLELEGEPPMRLIEAAGGFYERQGRTPEARALYTRAQTQYPESILLPDALARLGRAPAPALFVDSVERGLAEAMFDVASALRRENSGQNALVYARLGEALAPSAPIMLLLVGETLEGLGQREAANAIYERIDPSAPAGYPAQLRLAENLHGLGKTDEAIGRLEALASRYPERPEPLVSLGVVLRLKERFAEAAAAYIRAISRLTKIEGRHWTLFYARGISYERSKQWKLAEADFERALELQPEQPDVLNYLAYSWVDQGLHVERARKMLERAVELRPNSGHIIDSLGWALYRIGQFDDAVLTLERAVELVPEDPVIVDHLGDAYWRVGRTSEARFQWRRSLRNKPEADLKVQIEKKLESGLPAGIAPGPRPL